jgi:hypothetical protein
MIGGRITNSWNKKEGIKEKSLQMGEVGDPT